MRDACISKDYREHSVPFSTQGCVTLHNVHCGLPSLTRLFQWDGPQSFQLKIQPLVHPLAFFILCLWFISSLVLFAI